METFEELWRDVEIAVCSTCDDSVDGKCGLKDSRRCPLKSHFSRVIEVVSTITSADYGPYVQGIRSRVCPECRYVLPDGSCPRREHAACTLDRYHALVVGVLEQGLFGSPISAAMEKR